MIEFPISGIETYWWLPMVVAFCISSITSTAGISGAFILMPFQISILGFTAPGVTPTNLLFNIFGIPSGVYRFYREKRMVWSLTWVMILGSLPGLFLGVIIRVRYLPDPKAFKFFVGLVLLYVAIRLILDILRPGKKPPKAVLTNNDFVVVPKEFSIRRIAYQFNGVDYQISTIVLLVISAIVGTIGGIYGIGGGAIVAPILVTFFRLPVHTISGAVLCGTFLSSVVGVFMYVVIGPAFARGGGAVQPDWLLGLMLGIGGAVGIYVGARLQKFLPARAIKIVLGLAMLFIAGKYIIGFFTS
jgi:uncharacterized membrane protein YfcA